MKKKENRILSLFANIGVSEAYLEEIGFKTVVANELIEKRANLYKSIYPNTKMVSGDILNTQIFEKVITLSKSEGVNIIMATPPCQGMSTAGKNNEKDERNRLIIPVVNAVIELEPDYVLIENVPQILNTSIKIGNKQVLIVEYINEILGLAYEIEINTINVKNFSVPQSRERTIILLSKKNKKKWIMPNEDEKIITLKEAIGEIPIIDPFIKDVNKEEFSKLFPLYSSRRKKALSISKWNIPPTHVRRQVVAMQNTPTGCSAFENKIHYPVKYDGTPVKGFKNTYKRQSWDQPAFTITMDNRKISSQNNVHPGRFDPKTELYTDARALTLYEIMKVMSIPDSWPIPEDVSESFVRRIIGEGIPPLFIKKLFIQLIEGENE